MWSGAAQRIRRMPLLTVVLLLALALAVVLILLISSSMNARGECPLYPEAVEVSSLDGGTTYATKGAFGDVLRWYEGQHHEKGEIRPAPHRGLNREVEASYSLAITHTDAAYLVTVYTLAGEAQTFIDVADLNE